MKRLIPNILTILRLMLIPLVVYFSEYNRVIVAFALFSFAALTDFFDGYLSRLWGVESEFGALWDPVADKVLVMVFFIYFYIKQFLGWYLVFFVCLRDLLLICCIPILKQWFGIEFNTKPIFMTKLSSSVNMVLVSMIFFNNYKEIPNFIIVWVSYLALILCLATFVRFLSFVPMLIRGRNLSE